MKFWNNIKSWFIKDDKLIDTFRENIAKEEVAPKAPKPKAAPKKPSKPRVKAIVVAAPKTPRKPRAKKAK